MKVKNSIAVLGLVTGLLAGCQSPAEVSKDPNAWVGEYHGTLPCADCAGMKTRIVLFENNLFTKTETAVDNADNKFSESGEIVWGENKATVTLVASGGESHQYKVSDNALIMLDANGQAVTGELADDYVLTKLAEESEPQ